METEIEAGDAVTVTEPASALTDIPFLLEPQVLRAVEQICARALAYSAGHSAVRSSITALTQTLRMYARDRFGDTSVDVIVLTKLLRQTDQRYLDKASKRKSTEDPIEWLVKKGKLTPQQGEAGTTIQRVIMSLGKFLSARVSNPNHTGGRRSRPVDPVVTMGKSNYEVFFHQFKPWRLGANARFVNRRTKMVGKVRAAEVVYAIVVDGYHPRDLDRAWRLNRGAALLTLRFELDAFIVCGSRQP